jgi:hypothetical protein
VAAAVEWVDALGNSFWSRLFGGGARVAVGGNGAGRWSDCGDRGGGGGGR